MVARHTINVDLAKVFASPTGRGFLTTLAWGDPVEVLHVAPEHVEIRTVRFVQQPDGSILPEPASGFVKPSRASGIAADEVVVEKQHDRVLKVDFVDVQQGDGAVVETPTGTTLLIDGGDNQLFARYLAGRYRDTTDAAPKEIDCIIVTHGDADHCAGLTEIHKSETHKVRRKRLFIRPRRVYHNGLVKRPRTLGGERLKEAELLGETTTVNGATIITELENDLLTVDDAVMNAPFRAWKKALRALERRGPIEFRRLAQGADDAFDFLADEEVRVEVLGPILSGAGATRGLKFLGKPRPGPRVGHEVLDLGGAPFTGLSASHTINGHSVILRLTYGRCRFLFSGDLNDEAGRVLTAAHERGELDLRAEVFKVPHHGSADFSVPFLKAVAPVVSIVSSGDETARKEYIHPRSTLMGALGRYSRVDEPLIFVTELVAFFQTEGWVQPEMHQLERGVAVITDGNAALLPTPPRPFFAFRRTAFGIVKIRTDGERLLVYTNSGQADLKEAYAYRIGQDGAPVPERVRQA